MIMFILQKYKKVTAFIIILGGMILSYSSFYHVKAETDNSWYGYYHYNLSYNQVASQGNTIYYEKLVTLYILTNDPTCSGSFNPTLPTGWSGLGSVHYSGMFTTITLSLGTVNTLPVLPSPAFGGSAFTYSGNNQNNQEVNSLDSTQYNGLIAAINSISGGSGGSSIDYTALLTAANGLLQNIYNNLPSLSGSLDLSTLLSAVQNIYSKVNNIDSTITNIYNSIIQLTSDILTRLDSIDSIIDTISWNSATFSNLGISTDLTNWQSSDLSALKFYQAIQVSSFGQNLYKFVTGVRTNWLNRAEYSPTDIKFYLFNNSTKALNQLDLPFYISNENRTITLYINANLFMQNDYYLLIEYSNRVNLRYDRSVSLNYITPDDIEYWTIVSFINDYQYYKKEYPDLDQSNDNLSDAVNDYINTEDQMISGFTSSMSSSSLDPSQVINSNPANWGVAFIETLTFITFVFNNLTGLNISLLGNPFYMLITFSLMLGLALLIIGKRGSA